MNPLLSWNTCVARLLESWLSVLKSLPLCAHAWMEKRQIIIVMINWLIVFMSLVFIVLFSACKSTIFSWNIPIILSFFDYRKQIICLLAFIIGWCYMTESICCTTKLFINYQLRRIKPVSRFSDTFAPSKRVNFALTLGYVYCEICETAVFWMILVRMVLVSLMFFLEN